MVLSRDAAFQVSSSLSEDQAKIAKDKRTGDCLHTKPVGDACAAYAPLRIGKCGLAEDSKGVQG
jgi:hypothetical protein